MARKSNPILDNLQTVPSIEDTNITKAMLLADKAIVICYLEHGPWAPAGIFAGGASPKKAPLKTKKASPPKKN